MKLIQVYVDKKFLLPFRLVMFLIASPFVIELINVFSTGVARSHRGIVYIYGVDSVGFIAYVFNQLAFALFLLWLATWGTQEKKEKK